MPSVGVTTSGRASATPPRPQESPSPKSTPATTWGVGSRPIKRWPVGEGARLCSSPLRYRRARSNMWRGASTSPADSRPTAASPAGGSTPTLRSRGHPRRGPSPRSPRASGTPVPSTLPGGITCWGSNLYGQLNVPALTGGLTYTSVTTGYYDTCAIRSDGTVDCWGRNSFQQDSVPAGTFTQINAGYGHVCGLRPDQTITCWGLGSAVTPGPAPSGSSQNQGQGLPPAGTYNNVTTGTFHSCAMRTDGVAVCWGNNAAGRVRPIINMPTTNNTGAPPPPIVVGTPYNYQLSTSYVSPALTWTVVKGSLPPASPSRPTACCREPPPGPVAGASPCERPTGSPRPSPGPSPPTVTRSSAPRTAPGTSATARP